MSANTVAERLALEVDELVAIGSKLAMDASHAQSRLGPERIQELALLVSRGGQLIRRLYGVKSQYERDLDRVVATKFFNEIHANNHAHISEVVGILRGVQQDIRAGLLTEFKRLAQAEIFADYLEMAAHLLGEGYKDASAVLLGATLEDSLRKIAEARSIPTNTPAGKPLTIDPMNIALAKDEAYGPLVQKQVTTWANLRNDAAHGHFERYDNEQVKQMLLFVQKFCADYLS
jgi:hypothetical protein